MNKKIMLVVSAFALFFNVARVHATDNALSLVGRPYIKMDAICTTDSSINGLIHTIGFNEPIQCVCYEDDSIQFIVTNPITLDTLDNQQFVFCFKVYKNCLVLVFKKEVDANNSLLLYRKDNEYDIK